MERSPDTRREASERYVIWRAEGVHCSVACSEAILEKIRRQCVLAARGPVPLGIGGALIGQVAGGEYRIHEWHQIPCRHQRGPSFLLTKEEVGGLKEFLSRLPERTGFGEDTLIGWFVSHPFLGAEMRDDEISLHQRFFRSNDLFLLVEVHPDGSLRILVHRGARPLQPVWSVMPPLPLENHPVPATPRVVLPPRSSPDHLLEDAPRKAAGQPQRAPLPKAPVFLALASLAVILAIFTWSRLQKVAPLAPPPPAPQPIATLSLHIQRQQEGFLIRWDPGDPALSSARQVLLRITEGARTTEQPLSPSLLQAGSFLHKSAASSLEVEMRAQLPDGRFLSEKVLYQP